MYIECVGFGLKFFIYLVLGKSIFSKFNIFIIYNNNIKKPRFLKIPLFELGNPKAMDVEISGTSKGRDVKISYEYLTD